MKLAPSISNIYPSERFEANSKTQLRAANQPLFLLESPATLYNTLRFATRQQRSLVAFSSVLPLLLWAEQQAPEDTGGTWVFLVCCALSLFIFSKTGWRNEPPR